MIRTIVTKYFEENPESKDGVMKAWYAYHAPHFRVMPGLSLHNFTNGSRESKCVWCGRSRELVRHDEQPAQCGNRPVIREIKDVLHEEALHFFELLRRAETEVPKLLSKMGMSGETLAVLHHTYGHDPEIVLPAIEFAPFRADYEAAMERESVRSRAAQKKTVITCETKP